MNLIFSRFFKSENLAKVLDSEISLTSQSVYCLIMSWKINYVHAFSWTLPLLAIPNSPLQCSRGGNLNPHLCISFVNPDEGLGI